MHAKPDATAVLLASLALPIGCSADPEHGDPGASASLAVAVNMAANMAAEDGTKRYRAATGMSFRHPASWRVQESATGRLNLIPGDLATLGNQPTETLTLMGERADGIQSARDARVSRYVIQVITRGVPYLRPTGNVTSFAVAGRDCIELRFVGGAYQAAAQVTILADTVLIALTLTTHARFARRHAAMDALFRSIRPPRAGGDDIGPVSRDANLVGRWCHTKMYTSGSFSSTVVRYLALGADGSLMESGGGDVARGRWRTEGQRLIINWSNGSTTIVAYQSNGQSMNWRADGESKFWSRN